MGCKNKTNTPHINYLRGHVLVFTRLPSSLFLPPKQKHYKTIVLTLQRRLTDSSNAFQAILKVNMQQRKGMHVQFERSRERS